MDCICLGLYWAFAVLKKRDCGTLGSILGVPCLWKLRIQDEKLPLELRLLQSHPKGPKAERDWLCNFIAKACTA